MPRDAMKRSGVVALLLLGFLGIGLDQRLEPRVPARLPDALRVQGTMPAPRIHVFLRPGCRSCDLHLQELEAALGLLADALQPAVRRRILTWQVGSAGATGRSRPLPMSTRRLGIHATPTTWFVSASDSICHVWLGARSSQAWQRGFAFLQGGPTP